LIPVSTFSREEIDTAAEHRLFVLMKSAYAKMLEESETDDHGNKIWRGKTTELFPSIGAHVPEQSYVTRLFKMMDVAQQITKGHRGTPSEWVLVQEPKPEIFILFKDKIQDMRGGRRTSKLEVIRQDQGDLASRVKACERFIANLLERLEVLEDDYDTRMEA